jgi:hypothetical protein
MFKVQIDGRWQRADYITAVMFFVKRLPVMLV